MEIAKKAHWECPNCHADIIFDKEDILTKEDTETKYGNNSWESTKYVTTTTYYVTCPVCDSEHIIKTTSCEKSSRY